MRMTQEYLAGELSVRLEQLQAATSAKSGSPLAHLRHQIESSPPTSLAAAVRRALALAEDMCWDSLAQGDALSFARQAAVSADLRQFGICARLRRKLARCLRSRHGHLLARRAGFRTAADRGGVAVCLAEPSADAVVDVHAEAGGKRLGDSELEGPPAARLARRSEEERWVCGLAAEAVGEVEVVGDEEDSDRGLKAAPDRPLTSPWPGEVFTFVVDLGKRGLAGGLLTGLAGAAHATWRLGLRFGRRYGS